MKGYKGFNSDMTCLGFQYEVGKEYEMDGKPELCERGFHFCKTMAQVFSYYSGTDKRYAEVEAIGEIKEGDDKCVTNKIRIIREIQHQEAVDMTNTGNRNTGNRNTGDWNTTIFSAGCFNTELPKMMLFNKPSEWTLNDWWGSSARYILSDAPVEIDVVEWICSDNMTAEEKEAHPEHKTAGGYLRVTHEAPNRQEWWDKLSETDKQTVMALPNFDAEIFKRCTGIEVRTDG